jgi:hypothetical protein
MTSNDWRLVQSDADEQEIYLVTVAADGAPAAFGPLAERVLTGHWYGRAPVDGRTAGPEQIALARDLEARSAQFHGLDRYFEVFFPADVAAWVDQTPETVVAGEVRSEGRPVAQVAERLGVDPDVLDQAAYAEGGGAGLDSAGDPWFYPYLGVDNWALASQMGVAAVNPKALRFKAWLAFRRGDRTTAA